MKLSQYHAPTLKETPSDAEVISHKLMLRAGMIRKLAAGVYMLLPLGLRVIRKIETIVREEMNRAGALEVLLPSIQPAELWQESGRWDFYGPELLRIKDRHDRMFAYGPTHEEVITDLVRRDVRSYSDLPVNLYPIQTKFRDEIRPRFGLMRGREFIMKDAYSFDVNEEGANKSYAAMKSAYAAIFRRCGLMFGAVEADTGNIGGSYSHEFMVMAETGEDQVVSCDTCTYAANMEKAQCRPLEETAPGNAELKRVDTPGQTTVEEVCAFLKVPQQQLIKTLILKADGKPVAALLRGDHELNEIKLQRYLKASVLEMADPETIQNVTGAPVGFAGPVGMKSVPIIADYSVAQVVDAVVGGNAKDVHSIGANRGRDFTPTEYADIRKVVDGDRCPVCEDGKLKVSRGIEVGHIFKLGTKYSEPMRCTFLDENGKEVPMIMGCYGIGIGRTAAAAIEQNHDENGIVWPLPIAPFAIALVSLSAADDEVKKTADDLYAALTAKGVEVLYDDRDERPGVKFKDADLLGMPLRVTVGGKGLKEGVVEMKPRSQKDFEKVPVHQAVERILAWIGERSRG